ncbi:UDP-N-acetylmuramoyl-L-alanine--D-glutamate ligase [Pseudoteredinibacter isoporae]|uniref:UDP-N-acetylmuramoylalanine--D-glutamate ligase n=1 Tax=Pseudoteredinibacter isoporae TaxID=570281 RepID=A0A7X0JWJ7_9GAMM|nr:UDP-N-acetylmuramoyl-L-alanine--D-glutamate ligase [Pseudoteredinibacter isoporae]MBB6522731.1 UDP-N-acetylmuramoylalanine--D-glutamate ligase [Pseudoteredinibacter isoporae]NHO88260.1 UDP-N-acetylmuramoyl-L-alanine--D-glutamate ligase [Pseudoteredinibacter isoporae]NIB23409.1 UDP-N-acetylmuramoyl-L-alanine--D-glutamate ligase [Pseudoteredinibacter isoporae]
MLIGSDKMIAVVGLGLTGLSYARYLESRGIAFVVMDTRKQPPMLNRFEEEFADSQYLRALHLDGLHQDSLMAASEILLSPGFPMADPALQDAIASGIKVHGDMSVFAEQCEGDIVAITGSNAKSTVTAWLGHMAQKAGIDYGLGGNIGTPVLSLLNEPKKSLYILELSSFQLEATPQLGAKVASILNISADHQDRYEGMAAYHQTKQKVYRGAKQVVFNRRDPLTQALLAEGVKQVSFGLNEPDLGQYGVRQRDGVEYLAKGLDLLLPVASLSLAGQHNVQNALAALALGEAAGLEQRAMLEALQDFPGLAHRCEFVASVAGVDFINDSKGTNTGASVAALEGLGQQQKLVLIAGGVGKGANFEELRPAISKHCRALVCIGQDGERIAKAMDGLTISIEQAEDMPEAVQQAFNLAQVGDAVLLSPACASFDMYANFEARGDAFKNAVKEVSHG